MPMVEPEVLMDGDHDIQTCYEVTEVTLRSLFDALYNQNVMLEGTILKASMIVPGKDSGEEVDGRRRRREHPDVPEDRRAGDPAGHRVPLRRPERRGRHRAPRRDEPHGPEPVAAVVLLRPRDAVRRAEDLVAGHRQQRRARRRKPSTPAPATTAWPRWASGSRRPRNCSAPSPASRGGLGWGHGGEAAVSVRSACFSAIRRSTASIPTSLTVFNTVNNTSNPVPPPSAAPIRIDRCIGNTRR